MKKFLKAVGFGMLSHIVFIWTVGWFFSNKADVIAIGMLVGFGVFIFFLLKKEKKKEIEVKQDVKIKYLVEEFEIVVTGSFHKSKQGLERQELIKDLEVFAPLKFQKEPTNEYDPNAILVLNSDNNDIGYVRKSDTKLLHEYLNDDYFVEAYVKKKYRVDGGKGIVAYVDVREYRN